MDPDEILVSFDYVSLFTCIPTRAYCKTWTGLDWTGFVKGGFVKHGFVKGGFTKECKIQKMSRRTVYNTLSGPAYKTKTYSGKNTVPTKLGMQTVNFESNRTLTQIFGFDSVRLPNLIEPSNLGSINRTLDSVRLVTSGLVRFSDAN